MRVLLGNCRCNPLARVRYIFYIAIISRAPALSGGSMGRCVIIAAALLAMHVAPLYSAQPSQPRSVRFDHFDWEIVCDNTRTCRAAGYQLEKHDDTGALPLPLSVQLVRQAGPHQAVTAELRVLPKADDRTPVSAVEMKINGRSTGHIRLDKTMLGEMSPAQVNALVAALAKDSVIKFSDGRTIWTLSTHGAAAVLLKMDEFQGRIGTPGALLRKGNKPEDAVLPPLPMPVVLAAAVPENKEGVDPLAGINQPLLLAELRKGRECDELGERNNEEIELDGMELSKDKLLVSTQCYLAAYNTSDGYWVINRRPPYAPVLVTIGPGADYENGAISTYSKVRAIGDCVEHDVWTWDGQQFVLTLSERSNMCRGFAGGAWAMSEYVASVRKSRAK